MVKECLRFANDCLRWAAEAEMKERRTALLKLASIWLEAASRDQGVVIPQIDGSLQPSKPRRTQVRQ
jgi:hypothetical protein